MEFLKFSLCFSTFWLISLAAASITSITQNTSDTKTETVEYGPVTVIMDNLAQFAVNVSDETSVQLQARIERTVNDLNGNIEVIIANAMEQLADTIYSASDAFNNRNCNLSWDVRVFRQNIDAQLAECTQSLLDTTETFRNDGSELINNVQALVQQIAQLPLVCQILNASPLNFSNGTNCFVQGIADINQNMALAMNRASLLLVRTRQLSQQSVSSAQQCADSVVSQNIDFLSKELENCT